VRLYVWDERKSKMKNRFATGILAAAALLSAGSLFAHGGAEHVMGFARSVSADSVTVETAKHEMITVMLTPKTEIKKSEVKADIMDLKVGDRVMVHAEKNKEGKLEAEEVEWGPTPKK
jgi:hypothetical protein